MSFQIDRGLFRLDFIDHHAILGVPVDADVKDIRKRYLKIARRLHPDSCASESESDTQLASQFLSKLVNPAWEKLSQDKERSEYILLLKLKGQQALRLMDTLGLAGNLAKQLSTASNPDHFYHTSLKDLAGKQYDHFDQSLELIAQISELNLVYLMRKESTGGLNLAEPQKSTIYTGSNIPDSSQAPSQSASVPQTSAPPATARESVTDQYYRRAEVLVSKNNFAQAILELRDALKMDPSSSRCHSLMGMVYLRQNQATMAKIHFNQALKYNPEDPTALEAMRRLEQPPSAAGKQAANAKAKPAPKAAPKSTKPNDKNDKSGGGLFGLFGKKK